MGKTFILILIVAVLFLTACTKENNVTQGDTDEPQNAMEIAEPEEPAINAGSTGQKQESTPEGPKRLEVIIGGAGKSYNGNTQEYFMANSVVDFTGVGRENLGKDKFYLERLWNVRQDYSTMVGNSGSLVISTTAKRISMDAESPEHYADIHMRKGEGLMPENEMGNSVAIRGDGMPAVKIKERGIFNLVNRKTDKLAVYNIAVERQDLRVYKIILEY